MNPEKKTQDARMLREAYSDYPYADCKDHVVLDLGAHIGGFTKRALEQGATKVIAVEPWPRNLEKLRDNFGNDPRVHIIPKAVASTPHLSLSIPRIGDTGGVSGYVKHRKPSKTKKVEAQTLESILCSGWEPTFVKMDIEGAEFDVLPCNLNKVRVMCGELHTMKKENVKKALMLLAWLEDQRFSITYLKTGPMREKMFERTMWMHFHAHRK